MSLQLPNPRHTLSEPKPDIREANDDDDQDSNSFQLQQVRIPIIVTADSDLS